MILQTILIFTFIVVQAIPYDNSVDPNLTVEKANAYIAKNKDSVVQTYRLKYHFMAPIGWINDPNGFIQYKGEYHLFYQYNPYNATPNEIHWGHAKSTDLVLWEDLPVALAPDKSYDEGGVFSGTSLVDDGKLVVVYTGNTDNAQVQCLASSTDGITFDKIPENPIISAKELPENAQPQDFRDPKIFKRKDLYYIVTVSKTVENTGQVLLYESLDLLNWRFKSILLQGNSDQGIMWECPDLFELDGKDVLIISAIQMPPVGDDYHNIDSVIAFVGTVDWDEGKFNVDTVKELDHGTDFYATQTLLDNHGRRVAISWMNMWGRNQPTAQLNHKWAGAMTLPRVLNIKNNYLVQTPVDEIQSAYDHVTTIENQVVNDDVVLFNGVNGKVGVLELDIDLSQANSFTIDLRKDDYESTTLNYATYTQELSLNRTYSGIDIVGDESPPVRSRQVKVPLEDNKLKLQIFLDVSSVEVFANNGTETLTAIVFPREESSGQIQFSAEGKAVINSLSFSKIQLK